MDQEVFSKKEVIEASDDLVCMHLDSSQNPDPKKFSFSGIPSMFIVDSNGDKAEKFDQRTPDGLIGAWKGAIEKYARKVSFDDKAEDKAKELGKALGIFFTDESDNSKAFTMNLRKKEFVDILKNFELRQIKFDKEDETAKNYKVTKANTLVMLDPYEGKVLGKTDSTQSAQSSMTNAMKAYFSAQKKRLQESMKTTRIDDSFENTGVDDFAAKIAAALKLPVKVSEDAKGATITAEGKGETVDKVLAQALKKPQLKYSIDSGRLIIYKKDQQ